jgi:zinc and cadmium transporter
VLLNAGYSKARALFYNLLSGLSSVAGGVGAYFLLADSVRFVPFVLMIAAASFIYVALADLVPDMHRQSMRKRRESGVQLLLMIVGVAIIAALTSNLHAH